MLSPSTLPAWTLCLSLAALTAAASGPQRLEIFTTAEFGVTGQDLLSPTLEVELHALDGAQRVAEALGRDLPREEHVAREHALARWETGKAHYEPVIAAARRAFEKAVHYRLERYPAVVIDGGAAVIYGVTDYGVTDLPQAVALYQQHLAAAR